MRSGLSGIAAIAIAALLGLCGDAVRAADTFTVSTTADSGPGSLRQAMIDSKFFFTGGTINIATAGTIVLAEPLPIIDTPLVINGNGILISGNNQHRIFFVDAPASAVNLNNMVLLNGRAKGGDGNWGGGGGMGAGGALFLDSGNLTLNNVGFTTNSAAGGSGSYSQLALFGGGGGGLGGPAGAGDATGGGGFLGEGGLAGLPDTSNSGGGGGGGLYGRGGNGKVHGGGGAGFANGAHATDAAPGFGGVGGGGNGSAGSAVGGGGGGGGSPYALGGDATSTRGGHGGKYGGGGGHVITGGNGGDYGGGGGGDRGGNGGLGGGGGGGSDGGGGNGGFGGGGGGARRFSPVGPGAGGAFGGAGGVGGITDPGGPGGGGAALGAHVFVRPGASITFTDSSADAGTLIAGTGGTAAAGSGQTRGSSFFLGGNAVFSISAGQTRAITGSIADVDDQLAHPTAAGLVHAGITKTGPGTLILAGINRYNGATVISQGTLQIDPTGAQQLGDSTFILNSDDTAAADTLLLIGPANVSREITVANLGTGQTTLGSTIANAANATFNGSIELGRSATLLGQNTTTLPANHDGGQTRFNAAMSGAGGVTIAGGNMVQFRSGSKRYFGETRITGNSTLSLWDSNSTPARSTVHIEPGSTLFLEGLTDGVIGGLSGSGQLRNNSFYAGSKLTVGENNTNTSFNGSISGAVDLIKSGTGRLELGALSGSGIKLTAALGEIRITGDHAIGYLTVPMAAKGTQAVDLAGHTMRLRPGSDPSILETELNNSIGTSSDGIYDSTAGPNMAVGIAWESPSSTVLMKLTVLGDANVDGEVSFADLVTVAANFGKTNQTWDQGDFNRDHTVTFEDLVNVAANFGGTFPASIPGASDEFNAELAAAQVPEPAGGVLLCTAGVLCAARRKMKQKIT